MEASLTSRENLYARTRMGTYGRARRGWDALPEWNPRTERVTRDSAAAFAAGDAPALSARATPVWNGQRPTTWQGWRDLGERVFFELPLRHEPFWEVALRDPRRGEELGVITANDGTLPGLVWMRGLEGETQIGITCALCHAARAPGGGDVVAGHARRSLDYGQIRIAFYESRGTVDPVSRERWESWGPGRADVIEDVADTPIEITDLWGLRHERRLTQAGTLTHDSPLALFVRQETQYIQANHHHARPPRALMFALSIYLYSLEPYALEAPDGDVAPGEAVFGRECARCHHNAAHASDHLTPASRVGTDPELAMGNARGTGGYRASPLIRVAHAGPYLHDGSVPSLEDLLGGERFEEEYTRGRAPGPVRGHAYGTGLPDVEREALLAYLGTL